MIQPETQIATVGNDRVAYQVPGDGPRDVVYTSGFWSHLDIQWEDPGMARFFRRLASFSRLIRFDRRGTGLSDRPSEVSSSEVERWLHVPRGHSPTLAGGVLGGPLDLPRSALPVVGGVLLGRLPAAIIGLLLCPTSRLAP
jgi:pimeloyl-ACP methyl ester carboxylesterase